MNQSPNQQIHYSPLSSRTAPGLMLEIEPLDWQSMTWPEVWREVNQALYRHQYTRKSRQMYRSVLRAFCHRYDHMPPRLMSRDTIDEYIRDLALRGASWSWLSVNISVLRTVFDKLCRRGIMDSISTPRRPDPLPEILSHDEISDLFDAADSLRDRLLLAFLYGCGLKVGEACRLTWGDIDLDDGTVAVRFTSYGGPRTRTIPLPAAVTNLLARGKEYCQADDWIFAGRRGRHLSERHVQSIIRRTAREAGIYKPVSPMTLRHTYAVHALEDGATIRAVQELLGHASVETTLRYTRCIRPDHTVSPIDAARTHERPLPSTADFSGHKEFFANDITAPPRKTPSKFARWLKQSLRCGYLCLQRAVRLRPTKGPP
jgi:site-specific recombinase XerD